MKNFIIDIVGIDIYEDKYDYNSGSKANRLRCFWIKEPNHIVGRLMKAMLEYSFEEGITDWDKEQGNLYNRCIDIADRLLSGAIVEDIAIIKGYSNKEGVSLLSKEILRAINDNTPEVGLDRLHTFLVKFFTDLCDKYGLIYNERESLHNLFKIYSSELKTRDLIESDMTDTILRMSIGLLSKFNEVRNHRSLAHPNKVLGYRESLLIFRHISNLVNFIFSLEESINKKESEEIRLASNQKSIEDDFPF